MGNFRAGFLSGIEDLGYRLVAGQHRLPVQQHDGHRGDQRTRSSPKAGRRGPFIWKWNRAGIRRLPWRR